MSFAKSVWYARPGLLAWLLLPFAALFWAISSLRRWAYRRGWLRSVKLPVPVIIVGNITAGGTGKTPLVIWLVGHLKSLGYRPGIISRGYGGKAKRWPQSVDAQSDANLVGDEALLLAQQSGCPVWVSPKRVDAAKAMLRHADVDLIISDDGLQHYALQRDIEIAVIDASRLFGNGFVLPAGPLRELPSRLESVDLVISNGDWKADVPSMRMENPIAEALDGSGKSRPLSAFSGRHANAVAGIGNPWRFFDMLVRAGIQVRAYPFADHHRFKAGDFRFAEQWPILMTAKDGVKCRDLGLTDVWQIQVAAKPDDAFVLQLDKLLEKPDGQQTA